ncbi:MAG: hypothetical protein KF789_10770 [Bdellovibrionaceae bacterium]|nr:hypothetical protein [Pseudobdellovibrionaceae bacterium]
MRFAVLIASSILSLNALASNIPSVLPDGTYEVSCLSYHVQKMESGEVLRKQFQTTGFAVYKSTNDSVLIQEQTTSEEEGITVITVSSTVNKYESLGANQYRQTLTGKAVFSYGNEMTNQDFSWARVFEVQGQLETNLRIENPLGAPGKEGFGETYTLKNSDTSYTIVGYTRAGAKADAVEFENGAIREGYEILASGNTCNYLKK